MYIELWDKHNSLPPERLEVPEGMELPGIVVKDGKGYARKVNAPSFELHELPLWIFPQPQSENK